jgi:hypothetical protein
MSNLKAQELKLPNGHQVVKLRIKIEKAEEDANKKVKLRIKIEKAEEDANKKVCTRSRATPWRARPSLAGGCARVHCLGARLRSPCATHPEPATLHTLSIIPHHKLHSNMPYNTMCDIHGVMAMHHSHYTMDVECCNWDRDAR